MNPQERWRQGLLGEEVWQQWHEDRGDVPLGTTPHEPGESPVGRKEPDVEDLPPRSPYGDRTY